MKVVAIETCSEDPERTGNGLRRSAALQLLRAAHRGSSRAADEVQQRPFTCCHQGAWRRRLEIRQQAADQAIGD